MLKTSLKAKLLAGSGALAIAGSTLVVAIPAFAIATTSSGPAAVAAGTRLDAAKLKLCTDRVNVIDSILKRVADRGNRHLTLISDVATKVETFYSKSGKTLDNYDSLVATVNSDKTAAQAAVSQVQSDSTSFNCSGSDPVGNLQTFKADVQAEITALQNYKAAVQALIAGVKSVVEPSSISGGGSQ
ncbi:MAG TPA: hypothetical protein VEH48_00030 [Candidatus Nitrosopolaris sp.]|nr:hypothetical protein [Candidatus Nitrosopolaris sp.]